MDRPFRPLLWHRTVLNDELGHTEWLRVHQLAAGEVDFRIRQILPEYWDASTPCDEWDVYDLVAHCVIENMRAALILEKAPFEEVMALDTDCLLYTSPSPRD